MSRIPCLVLAYYDFEYIKVTIECLLKQSSNLDLIVVENKSEFTDSHIKPYCLSLIASGAISKYILFEDNISNNAIEVVINHKLIDLTSSKYVLMTDADLLIYTPNWLQDEIEIMEQYPEVFVCTTDLDATNLPVNNFPEAINWIDKSISETEMYIETGTGLHLALIRTQDLKDFILYASKRSIRFVDNNIRGYCYGVRKMKWVKSKTTIARHLVWDRYADIKHPYTQMKISKSFKEHWEHNRYCAFHVYTASGVKRYVPILRMVRGHARALILSSRRAARRSLSFVIRK